NHAIRSPSWGVTRPGRGGPPGGGSWHRSRTAIAAAFSMGSSSGPDSAGPAVSHGESEFPGIFLERDRGADLLDADPGSLVGQPRRPRPLRARLPPRRPLLPRRP